MDEATEQKQTYLRTEIIDKGYDPEVFTAYISNLKGEDGIDLNLWSMEELVDIVKSFQDQQSSSNNVNTNEEYKQFYDSNNIQEIIEERKKEEPIEEKKEEINEIEEQQEIEEKKEDEKKEEEVKPINENNEENNNIKESSFNILDNSNKEEEHKEEIQLKATYTNIETPIDGPNIINKCNDLNGGAIEPKIEEIKEENDYKPPEPTGSIEDLVAAQNKDYYNNNSNHLTIDLPEKK